MNYLNVLAKALYDNVAESPDELSFRKGDIMTVLERNTQGLDGWWLCSLHGRQGIVPGNRLKILVGMYDKKQLPGPAQGGPPQPSLQPSPQPPPPLPPPVGQAPPVYPPQAGYTPLSPASQYTSMHPSYLPQEDGVYLVPPPSKSPGSLHHGPFQSPPGKQPSAYPKQSPPQGQDVYQVPAGPATGPQDIYQVPPAPTGLGQGIYQVPPSLDGRGRETPKTHGKVVVPTRVGQVYVYDSPKGERGEYDVPRHLQEIYDVPPTRGLLLNQGSQEVYDTPAMAAKGPKSREPSHDQEIYDVPPSVEKGLQAVYDTPPSVGKDGPEGPAREETYDVPPAFCAAKPFDPSRHPLILAQPAGPPPELRPPEDVYDVPPPASQGAPEGQEIYDVPPGLRKLAGQEVYDVPRELPAGRKDGGGDYIYDVPPQADREGRAGDGKRLSASSTGSARSCSSLDAGPAKEAAERGPRLEQEAAMEALARLQGGVSAAVSYLMSFVGGSWRSPEQLEAQAPLLRGAAEGVQGALAELLEFARGVVGSAAQASDRSLHAKLSKQVQKMEEVRQALVRHSQALDGCGWAPGSPEDLEQLVMHSRGVPDDTKQLASFLHGNASLLFRRAKAPPGEGAAPEKASSIQSRPLPSPPKFLAQDSPEGLCESSEGGWMEDYDYVHLQGKEEFEKTQKELLEKGNVIRQGKGQLEQQQLKQFERLEQEVARPIDHDLSSWTPPPHCAPGWGGSSLGPSDRQLLLFYLEQCEANLTTLTNAVDAFFTAVSTNQPPKIFVAHSKFVILSAHKLVFIGDTLARQAKAPEVRHKVTHYSNLLCDLLREVVATTKSAALHYPSPAAAKDMVERVHELASSTQQFRMALGQLVAM
ncbi:breast cancer anti-estrogen resistance protein 1 [Varanus komodoensis]|uniref:breast cancer anti-estrogen resistance protein 1 n=1 Tax=Varanus komodoensis TaxID=61221 RepID=UPI001CF77C3F|nr:breast cancer anti-estrogen resistance protein 1 [Varanus komodoensis]